MVVKDLQSVLERLYCSERAESADLEFVLGLKDAGQISEVLAFADGVRREYLGDGILVRGLVEFSNYCGGGCCYCGLNRFNGRVERYQMRGEEILDAAGAVAAAGVGTVVLQSGEDGGLEVEWLAEVISEIKGRYDIAVTLSIGERSREEYAILREAGADRYLLRIETSDAELYAKLHRGMDFEGRIGCLRDLQELGYQTGSGSLVGVRGQGDGELASDLRFFQDWDFDMVGIGPFIPHPFTELCGEGGGEYVNYLKVVALARIICKYPLMPASTAGRIRGGDAGLRVLQAGANVVMINFTPDRYRRLYEIYPDKVEGGMSADEAVGELVRVADSCGRYVDFSRGDSVKAKYKTSRT